MRNNKLNSLIFVLFISGVLFSSGGSFAQAPSKDLAGAELLNAIRQWSSTPVVRLTLAELNTRQANLDQASIDAVDKQWRDERKSNDQPLITAVLSSPLSGYLLRIQAGSAGLFTEIFVMTAKGLNAGQSSVTSDYWQADEAKFQKTFDVGPDAVFVDEPEFHEGTATWRCQVNLTLTDDDGAKIGALTAEVNLTELQRRAAARAGS
ncbi:hypothetical protein [Thalassobaculum sp.]|uniref:hypothetical protein n=1 Tax=Thalassobaculum sp. TaxID=2022740 RepID=UPI0032F06800